MKFVTVYSPETSVRLIYVLDWLLKEVLHLEYRITNNKDDVNNIDKFISYGAFFENAVSIPDCGLLWEKNIQQQTIVCGNWNNIPVLFSSAGSGLQLTFDIFSAIFFIITRYEEYYNYTPDKHGRYPVSESLIFKKRFLERPLIDEWILELYLLMRKHGFNPVLEQFSYQPTYDIDIAYSYKHKGLKRTVGALVKSMLTGKTKDIHSRIQVLKRCVPDPYDSFEWLKKLHTGFKLQPIYFVLAALNTTSYDKNISPLHPQMRLLIKTFSHEGVVGLHPSYYSVEEKTFLQEKKVLESITGSKINFSRQHYLRMKIPETYRNLINRGIQEDWSMGYGAKLGFRAGTGRSFLWYDLENEAPTNLRIHPFCFMDSTAHFEERLNVKTAFERLNSMHSILQKTHSRLVTVFHNFSLGSDQQWKGWREGYHSFLKNVRE